MNDNKLQAKDNQGEHTNPPRPPAPPSPCRLVSRKVQHVDTKSRRHKDLERRDAA